jgi:ParB/RepB/Spo0J family partition protein
VPAVPVADRLAAAAPALGPERLNVALAPGDAEEREIPVDDIDEHEENARKHFDQDAIQVLAESMGANGLLKSLLAYLDPQTKRLRLIGGARRLRAAKLLGWKTIRVRVLRSPPDAAKFAELMLTDNDQEDLHEVERGRSYDDYTTKHGVPATALAKKLGKSTSFVTRAIQLARKLPPEVHALIREGRLPPSIAGRLLARLPSDDDKRRFAALCVAQKLTAAQLAAAIKNGSGKPAAAGFTWEEAGVKVAVTLAGGDLAAAEAVLKTLLADLKKHVAGGNENFRQFLAKKALANKKAAELKAAQQALDGHPATS